MQCSLHRSCFLLAIFVFGANLAEAADWPQILGPQRNGVAQGEKLADHWPANGPKVTWKAKLGSGYAGPVAVGKRVIAFHRVGKQERLEAFSSVDGKSLWQADFPAHYQGGINPDTGPRCVPLVHRGVVYGFGAAGDLYAVDLATGKKKWIRQTYVDYRGRDGYFGAGATPIVVGERLLVNVGGRDDAGLVAFDLATGRTLWKKTDYEASYSSPTSATIGGEAAAIFVTRYTTVAIRASDGKELFSIPFGKRGPTVNAATPLLIGDQIFLTSSYGIGAHLYKIADGSMRKVWEKNDVLSSQYNTPIHHNGYLYGINGREDIGVASLVCVELKTGKVMWSEAEFGVAHLICAGDKMVAVRGDGKFTLFAADSTRYRKLATARVLGANVRAIPALSGGQVFARDGGELVAVVVGE